MILKPEHAKEEPSAVRSFTPEVEEETGARKTDTEAPESTRKHQEESLSWRYIREEFVEPAGKDKVSFCPPHRFPARNKEICPFGLVQRGSSDTSTGQESLNGRRWKMGLEYGGGVDQEWENGWKESAKQEDYRRREQGTHQEQRRYGSGRRQQRLGLNRSRLHGGPKIGGPWSCREPSVF